jgi:hypothetical protein
MKKILKSQIVRDLVNRLSKRKAAGSDEELWTPRNRP